MPVGDVLAVERLDRAARRANRASRRVQRALARRDGRRRRRTAEAEAEAEAGAEAEPEPALLQGLCATAVASAAGVAGASRWCPYWEDGDSDSERAREARWCTEAELKARLAKVRTDDGRRCLFAASVDGARVGVVVARRSPSIPDRPDAVARAVGAPPYTGQLPLLDLQNAPPRRLLFEPVADDVRVYARCIAAVDADGDETVPVFLLAGRDPRAPVVGAAAFGLDAADLAALQRAAARLLGAWS